VTSDPDPFRGPPSAHPDHHIAPGVNVAPAGLRIAYSRGSGPGGQNVNKVNTKAELWVSLSQILGLSPAALDRLRAAAGRRITAADELHLISDLHRTQEANRREIFQRLRELIIQASRVPKRRRKTKPSAASRRRRLDSKRHRSQTKRTRGEKNWE
jgi:ribosome-associated protein